MEPSEIFRRNIKWLIDKKRLVQSHVAEGIGESPQKLNNFLNGRINWGEQKRVKLSDFLGVDYHSLYNTAFMANVDPPSDQQSSKSQKGITENACAPAVDSELLAQVIEGVEAYLDDQKGTLEPKVKAQLVALLYDYFAKTGEKVGRSKVESYLKLVA